MSETEAKFPKEYFTGKIKDKSDEPYTYKIEIKNVGILSFQTGLDRDFLFECLKKRHGGNIEAYRIDDISCEDISKALKSELTISETTCKCNNVATLLRRYRKKYPTYFFKKINNVPGGGEFSSQIESIAMGEDLEDWDTIDINWKQVRPSWNSKGTEAGLRNRSDVILVGLKS